MFAFYCISPEKSSTSALFANENQPIFKAVRKMLRLQACILFNALRAVFIAFCKCYVADRVPYKHCFVRVGIDLAEKVCKTIETKPSEFKPLYDEKLPIKEKLDILAKEIYRANGVIYTKQAEKAIKEITDLGFGDIPVCVAKTQYSLSDDPTKLGKPENYEITVRDVRLSAGAGFVVAYTGDIMTMPGLPKKPAAYNIDCDNEGNIYGLF